MLDGACSALAIIHGLRTVASAAAGILTGLLPGSDQLLCA